MSWLPTDVLKKLIDRPARRVPAAKVAQRGKPIQILWEALPARWQRAPWHPAAWGGLFSVPIHSTWASDGEDQNSHDRPAEARLREFHCTKQQVQVHPVGTPGLHH
jgi:hypothetical protein